MSTSVVWADQLSYASLTLKLYLLLTQITDTSLTMLKLKLQLTCQELKVDLFKTDKSQTHVIFWPRLSALTDISMVSCSYTITPESIFNWIVTTG